LGAERVPDRQTILIFYWCPFERHTDGLTVNLATGRWHCQGGCGQGDVYDFEMKRSLSEHFRRSKQRVFEIISSAYKAEEANRIVEADAHWLAAKVGNRPGGTPSVLAADPPLACQSLQ
jgi:hypothetical protein